jgi:uncharacterized protein (TIGR00296 family)
LTLQNINTFDKPREKKRGRIPKEKMSALKAEKSHCFICFETLSSYLEGDSLPYYEEETNQVPLFVTWSIDRKLRGCIGNLSPQPFPEGLVTYAIEAGIKDSRFSPMKFSELTQSTCGVSLLINFEPDLKWDDWEVGIHGIVIKFKIGTDTYKAIFLPEVAKEQGWTKKQTLEHLVRKAGYSGKIDQKLLELIKLERFISSKVEATYDEWFATRVQTEISKRNKLMEDW